MFDSMDSTDMQYRFSVWFFHSDIEGSNGLVAHLVLTTYVNATQQSLVVDGEGRNFYSLSFVFLILNLIVAIGLIRAMRLIGPIRLLG